MLLEQVWFAVGADAKHEDRQVDEREQLTDVSHTETGWAYLQESSKACKCAYSNGLSEPNHLPNCLSSSCRHQKCHVVNFQSNRFGFGSGLNGMDDVSCNGEEPHILSCSYGAFGGGHNCAIWESVGVQCSEYVLVVLQTVVGRLESSVPSPQTAPHCPLKYTSSLALEGNFPPSKRT